MRANEFTQKLYESTSGVTPAGYTWSFEQGSEVPYKSDVEVNTFIRVRDSKGKTVLGVWADVYRDDVEIQYSEVFDKKLRGKGIYTDFLKGLAEHYNIISDQDHNNAARNIYKKLGADYNHRSEKHTLRRSSQGVAEDKPDKKTIKSLEKHYSGYDQDEEYELQAYTGGDYGRKSASRVINKPLGKEKGVVPPTIAGTVAKLDAATTRHVTPRELTVYYGTGPKRSPDIYKYGASVIKNIKPKSVPPFEMINHAYTSTTLDSSIADNFSVTQKVDAANYQEHTLTIKVPKGFRGAYVGHLSAMLDKYHGDWDELEFILPRGTRFTILPNPTIKKHTNPREPGLTLWQFNWQVVVVNTAQQGVEESWSKPKFNTGTIKYDGPEEKGISMFSAGYHPDVSVAWIEAIKSDIPGAGAKMIKSFEQWAKSHGAKVINAEALISSLEFWKKMGFTVAGKPNNKNRIPIQKHISQQGIAEDTVKEKITFKLIKGKNKFSTTMMIGDQEAGVYQYDAGTGRSIAEVFPEFKGKGLGKILILNAIKTAGDLSMNFIEDESRTEAYDNVIDSLENNGYIVRDDEYLYLTKNGLNHLNDQLKSLSEMALQTYKTMGDFSKPGPFIGPDKKLVPHQKNIEKATQFFEKTPYDFRLFFSNIPGTGKYSEHGPMTPDEIRKVFGKDAEEIINGSSDAITVVYVGNKGDRKVLLTPWMMAHRFGHAVNRGAYRAGSVGAWKEAEKHFFTTVNSLLNDYYGKVGGSSSNIKYELTPEYNALFNAVGTQRSSRSGEIRRPYEFFYELFAQYLGTGGITLNPFPSNLTYGRKAWGNPTKYMNIKPEYRDETERRHAAEVLAHDMEILFSDVLSDSVGKIFVM